MTQTWLSEGERALDDLMDEPEAYGLYMMFRRTRRPFFAVDPEILPDAIIMRWSKAQIDRAVTVLIERDFISEIIDPWGKPSGIYRHRAAFECVRVLTHGGPSAPPSSGENRNV